MAIDAASISPSRSFCNSVGWMVELATGVCKPVFCGSWRCPTCGPHKVRRWIIRIRGQPAAKFMTITMPPGSGDLTTENLKRLSNGWKKIRRWLKRKYGMVDHTWTREADGTRLHMHLICDVRRKINLNDLRERLGRAGLGQWVRVEVMRKQHAGAVYVAKYLAKTLTTRWPKYARRCQTTAKRWMPKPHCPCCGGEVFKAEKGLEQRDPDQRWCPTCLKWITPAKEWVFGRNRHQSNLPPKLPPSMLTWIRQGLLSLSPTCRAGGHRSPNGPIAVVKATIGQAPRPGLLILDHTRESVPPWLWATKEPVR